MDSKMYPQGIRTIKSKYVGGVLIFYNKDGVEIQRINPATGETRFAKITSSNGGMAYQKRVRATLAEVNAGLVLLAALSGFAYRLIDFTIIAIGGNAGGGTSVDLVGTRTTEVRPAVIAVAALTRSAAVKPNSANVTLLADGASHTVLDANTAVSISKQSGGSAITTSTHFDVILTYAIE